MENMVRKKKKNKAIGDDVDGTKENRDNGVCSENDFQLVDNLEAKKKRKKKKDKGSKKERDEYALGGSENEGGDANLGEMEIGGLDAKNGETSEVIGEDGESKKHKKKKKEKEPRNRKKRDEICAEEDITKDIKKKKRKREKEATEDDLRGVVVTAESLDKEILEKVGNKKRKKEGNDGETIIKKKGKEKKVKKSNNTNGKKGKKKVSFSNQVEVFPLSSDSRNNILDKGEKRKKDEEGNLVRGKRFSAEEDKILLEAVDNYIEEKGLGEEGLQMIRNCRSHPKVKGCWNEIAKALPDRPRSAVYWRAHIILDRGEKRRWSEEDCELLRKLHEKHGNQWKLMAEEFGRNRYHVKNTWRRLKVIEKQKGRWTQQEYQSLFDLVNTDLRLKISEDEQRRSKYGMLRDNIHWTAISDNLSTRSGPNCCMKWYGQLSSPMVTQGLWADSDDYRLISELFSVDAPCMEDVDWDNLLDHRSGDLCRMRWNQMVLHIGNHVSKSFTEQVEILARRYCPDMIEVREEWENKPYVD